MSRLNSYIGAVRISYMKLGAIHNSAADSINMVGMQIKRRLERLGVRQVEITRANVSNPEATVVADIGQHVILRNDLLIRVTSPDEFIVQVPTSVAKSIGISDSLVVHGIDQINNILAQVVRV